jgi:bifunctional DNA-binding transcriptional regulator/antitoxin component of YhaV-PrlF toxin-antitoxin module
MPEESAAFTAQVQSLRRVAIPKAICKALDIEIGDIVECRVRLVKKMRKIPLRQ